MQNDLNWMLEIGADNEKCIGLVGFEFDDKKWLARTNGEFFVAVRSDDEPTNKSENSSTAFRDWMQRRLSMARVTPMESLLKWTLKCVQRSECKNCSGTGIGECGHCVKGEARCQCPDCGTDHTKDCEHCDATGKSPCMRCTFAGVNKQRYHGILNGVIINQIILAYPFCYLNAARVGVFQHVYKDSDDKIDLYQGIWVCDMEDQWRIWIKGLRENPDFIKREYKDFIEE